jgi:glycosyltransferase involved in cell wall biosynthesis
MAPISVTVAICTWNRAELLRRTLQSFLLIDVPGDTDWRLLVVNNNCSDHTESVVRQFTDRLPIRSAFESMAGLSNARNRALDEAGSDYVLFTDDDVLVSRRWLDAFATAARRYPDAAAFGGPIEPWFVVEPDPDLAAAFPNLQLGFCGVDHHVPEGSISDRPDIETDNLIYGANMGFATRALAALRFNPAIGAVHDRPMLGDETFLVRKLRHRGDSIIWVPEMRVKHYVEPARMTLEYLLSYYEGIGRTHVKLHGRAEAATLFGAPRWLHRKRAEAGVKWVWHTVRHRRVQALEALREYSYYTGMMKEYREPPVPVPERHVTV